MMGTIAENFPCELKDQRQHGPIKQRHTLTKVSVTLMTKCRSKVKGPWSSSITSANAMPIPVINSRVVLIVRLICHDEKVYEEIIFSKTSQYKSKLHFPSQSNRACTKLTLSSNQPFYQSLFLIVWKNSIFISNY